MAPPAVRIRARPRNKSSGAARPDDANVDPRLDRVLKLGDQLRLTRAQKAAIAKLADERTRLAAEQAQTIVPRSPSWLRQLDDATVELDKLAPPDGDRTAGCTHSGRPGTQGDLDRALEDGRNELTIAESEAARALAQLPSVDRAARDPRRRLAFPAIETIDRFEAEFARIANEHEQLRSRAAKHDCRAEPRPMLLWSNCARLPARCRPRTTSYRPARCATGSGDSSAAPGKAIPFPRLMMSDRCSSSRKPRSSCRPSLADAFERLEEPGRLACRPPAPGSRVASLNKPHRWPACTRPGNGSNFLRFRKRSCSSVPSRRVSQWATAWASAGPRSLCRRARCAAGSSCARIC